MGLKSKYISLGASVFLLITTIYMGNTMKDQTPKNVFAAGETVMASFVPSNIVLPNSGTTQLAAAAGTNIIAAVNIEIDFDPTLVQLANEPALSNWLTWVLPGNTTMVQANTTGKLIIHLGKDPSSLAYPTGTFTVASLTWKSITNQNNIGTRITINNSTSMAVENSNTAAPRFVPVTGGVLSVDINPIILTPTQISKPTLAPIPSATLVPIRVTPTLVPTVATLPVSNLIFNATEDKTISQKKGNVSERVLKTDGSPVFNFLIKFEISGLNGRKITGAKLRLYNTEGSFSGGKIYSTLNNWNESTINWGNSPAAYGLVNSMGVVTPGKYYEVDVGHYVNGEGKYSFRVVSDAWDAASYSSSETSFSPQLVVTIQ